LIGGWTSGVFLPPPCPVFVYRLWLTPGFEFRENSRVRGRRSLSYGRQGSEAPLGAQTSPEQSGKADCGGRLSPGHEPGLGRAVGTPRCAEPAGRRRAEARAAGTPWAGRNQARAGGGPGAGGKGAARGHTLGGLIRARRAVFRVARAHVGAEPGRGPGRRAAKRSEFAAGPGEKALFPGTGRGGGGARLLQAASFPGGL